MKKSALVLLSFAAVMTAAPCAFAQVGVAVTVGQPGFYGNINIGSAPPPVTVYQQPILVQPTSVPVEPIYLRVPTEHYRNWPMYCGRYNACGRPVHFVNDDWYNRVYAPHYQHHRGEYERGERYDNWEHGRERREERHESHERYGR